MVASSKQERMIAAMPSPQPAAGAGLEQAEKRARELATEQAALRQIATVVARQSSLDHVLTVVAKQAATIFDVPAVLLARYEEDATFVVMGGFSERPPTESRGPLGLPVGSRWPHEGSGVTELIYKSGRPARVHDYALIPGERAAAMMRSGIRSAVGSPIVVEGRLWGVMAIGSPQPGSFPEETEARLTDLAELVAAAIANAESRAEVSRLAEEQAALRRVATLVASGLGPEEVFPAVAQEVKALFDADMAAVVRFETDGMATVMADLGGPNVGGARVALDRDYVVWAVRETRRPARFDTDDPKAGDMPEFVQAKGIRSGLASPIIVSGALWGAVTAASTKTAMPPGAESRIAQFTELVGTAVSNIQARTEEKRLAKEQAALRRVATLVARGVSPEEIFSAVCTEVGRLFGSDQAVIGRYEPDGSGVVFVGSGGGLRGVTLGTRWPLDDALVTTVIYNTGRSARRERGDSEAASRPLADIVRENKIDSTVGAPISVDGRLWGVILAGGKREQLPFGVEERLAKFTDLVATAIANAESRSALHELVDQQAALRRIATLVAKGSSPRALFDAVAAEAAGLLRADQIVLTRFEPGPAITVLAHHGRHADLAPAGTRLPLQGESVAAMVHRTGRSARLDSFTDADGSIMQNVPDIRTGIGSPVVVDGSAWGTIVGGWLGTTLAPPDAEQRLTDFGDLLAVAVANAESRTELAASEARALGLAREQAALRRVATRVAEGAGADELFAAVAHEVADVLDIPAVTLERFEGDGTLTVVGVAGETSFTVGSRWPIEDEGLAGMMLATGRPARKEDYTTMPGPLGAAVRDEGITSKVGVPIVVEGSVWGFMIGGARPEKPIPDGTEKRLARFTELVATAIANSHAREQVAQLASEQAALRRVATMVAQGGTPSAVFDAVAAEMEALLEAHGITLCRYEPGNELTVLAHRGPGAGQVPPGTRVRHDGKSVSATVRRTHQPARIDSYAETGGHIGQVIEGLRFACGVGAPIIVAGRLWGTTIANWVDEAHPPPDTEERVAKFTELMATAIANTQAQEELIASRARIVASADETRRRIVRDLHDGAQERLVHAIITLKLAQRAHTSCDEETARALVSEALDHAERTNSDLHELVHGILPGSLTRSGLEVGVKELASRVRTPVSVSVAQDRFPAEIEANAYLVIAEALTNVTKHSGAESVDVSAWAEDGALHLEVRDDGVGGARADGNGLQGLRDRVGALGGHLSVQSPTDGGTRVAATLPLGR